MKTQVVVLQITYDPAHNLERHSTWIAPPAEWKWAELWPGCNIKVIAHGEVADT